MLGPKPDFVVINKMSRLLNVYKVFAKSKTGATLTAKEKLLSGRVMALAIGASNVYLDQVMYEIEHGD